MRCISLSFVLINVKEAVRVPEIGERGGSGRGDGDIWNSSILLISPLLYERSLMNQRKMNEEGTERSESLSLPPVSCIASRHRQSTAEALLALVPCLSLLSFICWMGATLTSALGRVGGFQEG